MKVTAQGRKLIEQREGTRLKAYVDSVGVLTIGCGHTSAAGPPRVVPGMTITAAECDEILSRDLIQFEQAVSAGAGGVPLADHEFDACVSLAFNIGAGAFRGSTVARRLRIGDKAGAAEAFLMWARAGKNATLLMPRRKAERNQFLHPYD